MNPADGPPRGRRRSSDRDVDPDRRRAADRAPRRRRGSSGRRRGDLPIACPDQPRPQRLLRDRGPRVDERDVCERAADHGPPDALRGRHDRGRRRPPWSCASCRSRHRALAQGDPGAAYRHRPAVARLRPQTTPPEPAPPRLGPSEAPAGRRTRTTADEPVTTDESPAPRPPSPPTSRLNRPRTSR